MDVCRRECQQVEFVATEGLAVHASTEGLHCHEPGVEVGRSCHGLCIRSAEDIAGVAPGWSVSVVADRDPEQGMGIRLSC
jgi:hypothetical protein